MALFHETAGQARDGSCPSHADRMLDLLRDRTGAAGMGEAGVSHALRFSWDSTAAEILSVYREVLEAK